MEEEGKEEKEKERIEIFSTKEGCSQYTTIYNVINQITIHYINIIYNVDISQITIHYINIIYNVINQITIHYINIISSVDISL